MKGGRKSASPGEATGESRGGRAFARCFRAHNGPDGGPDDIFRLKVVGKRKRICRQLGDFGFNLPGTGIIYYHSEGPFIGAGRSEGAGNGWSGVA